MKLIEKAAVVAEIEKLIDEIYAGRPFDSLSSEQQAALWYVKSIMSSINNLKVKEVDLKEEIDKFWKPRFSLGCDDKSLLSVSYKGFEIIAKHFFELGTAVGNKAQKGEKV